MKFHQLYISIFLTCSVMLMGCMPEEKIPEPTGPEVPPPPTPQEIAQSIITAAQLDMPIPPKGSRFPRAIENNLLNILRQAKTKNGYSEDGQKAIGHVIIRIDKRIREFSEAEAWTHVMVFIKAREVFEPDNHQYLSLKEVAQIELRKPKVTVKGLPDINGVQFVILDFHIPLTDETFKNEKIRIGETAHGIKILSIFGQRRGVMLRYLETGEKYVAFLPASE